MTRYEASFCYCSSCGLLQAEQVHWLEEAYSSAIASTDTGLVNRNLDIACKLASLFHGMLGESGNGRYVDVAGGYGMLTRLMRDYGFDFYWSDRFCPNLMARGFEFDANSFDLNAAAVTAIEIMEHLEDPMAFVREALLQSRAPVFVFTTELFEGAPPPNDWWYYSFETGQHISFFQGRTLKYMADRLGMYFSSAHGVHVFSKARLSAAALWWYTGCYSRMGLIRAKRALSSRTLSDHVNLVQRIRTTATLGPKNP